MTGFCRIDITCEQVKQESVRHKNVSLHDLELPLKIRHDQIVWFVGQGMLLFDCLKWAYIYISIFIRNFIAVLNGTMCMCLKLKNVRILSMFKVIFPYPDSIACFLVWVCRSRYIDAGLQFLALKSPCLLNKYNQKNVHLTWQK